MINRYCILGFTLVNLHIVEIFDDTKQLLDEFFVISRIIKVEVEVISRRLRLITLTFLS